MGSGDQVLALVLFGEMEWQNMRALHDLDSSGGKRGGVLLGNIFAQCIPERPIAGLFRYTACKFCQNQLILDT